MSLLPSQVLVAINEMYLSPDKLTVSLLCKKLNGLLSLVGVYFTLFYFKLLYNYFIITIFIFYFKLILSPGL